MMYKNSFKLVFSKFSMVWKLFVYFVAVMAVICGINYLANIVVDNSLIFSDIVNSVPNAFKQFTNDFNFPVFFENLEVILNNLINTIVVNFSKIWINIVVFILLTVILPFVLTNFYSMPTSFVMNRYMSSNTNFAFTASLFVNLGKNIRYQLVSIITILPLKLLTGYLFIKSLALLVAEDLVLRILAPCIIMAIYVVVSAIRVTIFSGWVPYMIVKNANVFKSLVSGFACIRKRLPQIFANSIGVVLTNIVFTFLGIVTFGVSLIITAPACYLFLVNFNMVSFYTAIGSKYYVDNNNIYAPKKTELVESYKIYKNVM